MGRVNIAACDLWAWVPVWLTLGWCALAFNPSTYEFATSGFLEAREYTFAELGTLFFFLAASAIAGIVALNAFKRGARATTWVSFLIFSLLAFLVAMEEGHWGQPILDYTIPSAILDSNMQGEMTLHNLEEVQGWDGLFYVAFAGGALMMYLPRMAVIPQSTWEAIRPDRRLIPIVVLVLALGAIKTAEALFGNPFEPLQPIRWSSEITELLISYWVLAYSVLKLLDYRTNAKKQAASNPA